MVFVLLFCSCAQKQSFEALFEAGSLAYLKGVFETAKNHFDEAQKTHRIKNTSGTDYALMMRYLGILSYNDGDFLASKTYLKKSLQLIEKNLGKSHQEYPTAHENWEKRIWY